MTSPRESLFHLLLRYHQCSLRTLTLFMLVMPPPLCHVRARVLLCVLLLLSLSLSLSSTRCSEDNTTPLFHACATGEGALALRFIDLGGVRLDAVDTTDGTTPLHNACEMGLGKVALQLIASGHVDCAVQNTVDSTDPLHWATHNGLGKVAAALRAKASERDAQYIE